jgi:hypothetical protein
VPYCQQPVLGWLTLEERNQGYNVTCTGHAGCTANLPAADPISERHIGHMIGRDLVQQQVFVRQVTTDGDGRGAKGIKEAMIKVDPTWKTERLTHALLFRYTPLPVVIYVMGPHA